jgi:TonB family protein
MKKEKKAKHFIRKPVYEGGVAAMKEFVRKNLRYPKEALEKKVEGTVHLRYTINHKGKVIDTRIISGIGHGCDEEAMRLVREMTFRVPKNRKIRVQFHKTIHIHFRLSEQKPKPVQQAEQASSFQYQYIPSKKEEKATDRPKKGGGYDYQIRLG